MSQFTIEEWDKIVREKEKQVSYRDNRAARADEGYKIHTTKHYEMKTCPHCKGTKIIGLIFKGRCPYCDEEGQVEDREHAYYNSPGDPIGWFHWEKFTAPALERHELRQILIKRFMDLNPDHAMTRAIQADLVSGSNLLIKPVVDMRRMCVDLPLAKLDAPVILLNGITYGWETWGYSVSEGGS